VERHGRRVPRGRALMLNAEIRRQVSKVTLRCIPIVLASAQMDPQKILSCLACGSVSGLNQHGDILQCEDCGQIVEAGLGQPLPMPSSREGFIRLMDAFLKAA
jgi:hypothetical protein